MEVIELCIFGAGRIGNIHARCLHQNPRTRLRYVVDTNRPAAEALAAECGARVVDTETALNDPEVRAVVIASSTDTHADLIERAAKAGKAIFCEKPIDLGLERAKECAAVVREQKAICALGFNRRFDPQFSALKAAVTSGQIGDLEILAITSRDPSPPPAGYIGSSGGMFRDMMIHDLDMARWIMGEEPIEVFATASCLVDPAIAAAGDVDTALVTMKTESGKLCQINNSRRAVYGYDQRIEAFGSLGMLQARNMHENNLVLTNSQGSSGSKPLAFFLERYADAYRIELESFVDCILGHSELLANENDGVRALELAGGVIESSKTGRAVAV